MIRVTVKAKAWLNAMSKEKITIIGIILFSVVACGTANSKTVRQSDYGDKWPLTVSEATLLCKEMIRM